MALLPSVGALVALATLPAREVLEVTRQARETLAAVHRVATRMDGVLDELEQPLRDLAPGLRRLAEVLDDPAVATLPESLRRLQEDLLPVVRQISETTARVGSIPGASLFGLRRPPVVPPVVPTVVPPVTTVVVEDPGDPSRSD